MVGFEGGEAVRQVHRDVFQAEALPLQRPLLEEQQEAREAGNKV